MAVFEEGTNKFIAAFDGVITSSNSNKVLNVNLMEEWERAILQRECFAVKI